MIDPRIVISDYKIPDKDGWNFAAVSEGCGPTHIPVSLVTAQLLSPSNLEQAINAGVDDFLKKAHRFRRDSESAADRRTYSRPSTTRSKRSRA